jgi:hypothetical protein
MLPMGRPCWPISRFFVGNDFASWGRKSCFVVINKTMDVRRGSELWMQSQGSEEI